MARPPSASESGRETGAGEMEVKSHGKECGCRSSSISHLSEGLLSQKGRTERKRNLRVGWKMREAGKSAQAKASGQNKAMRLEARRQLQAMRSGMRQGCAYLLNQKHKAEPAGGASGGCLCRQHPPPCRAHFESCFLPANSPRHWDLPGLALGRAERSGELRASLPFEHQHAWPLTLPFNRHFLTCAQCRQRGHLEMKLL